MADESLASLLLSAVSDYPATADERTNSKRRPPFARRNGDESRPQNASSSWRPKGSGENAAPPKNWRDRSEPPPPPAAFSSWRSAARHAESNGAFQPNNVFSKRTSSNPFGERRIKLGPASDLSAPPGGATALRDSRNRFGSNSSIASDCSSSSAQPDGRKSFRDSRTKFGSGWSVAAESSTKGRGRARGGSHAVSVDARTGRRVRQLAGQPSVDYLERLSQKEVHEIVLEITVDKSPFDAYLRKSPLESDWLIRILSIVAKVCASDYEGNCSEILLKLCNSPFFDNLSNYLGQMTMEMDAETLGKLPVHDLCEFCSSLLDACPEVAVKKNLVKLVQKTKIAVHNIPLVSNEPLDEDTIKKLEEFVDTFDECKKMLEEKRSIEKRQRLRAQNAANSAPPDNFRHLSPYPSAEDLFRTRPSFVRPNIIKGAYENVEHYLDVQFRLLREDFVDSVRTGVLKYLASKSEPRHKFRFDSVRIYPETCLESWTCRNSVAQEMGIWLNFDTRQKFARTCNWEQNKRFMHGSLLLLTADDFKTFTCATVLERDVGTLRNGRVLAALVDERADFHKVFAKPFVMAESEVFFEPYFLILQALKKLRDESFPLAEYIVEGRSKAAYPAYPAAEIKWDAYGTRPVPKRILFRHRDDFDDFDSDEDDDDTRYSFWDLTVDHKRCVVPDIKYVPVVSIAFELDSYQTDAYEAGMEREFCVIQGPPGTGKTFLGLKLVESILTKCHSVEYKLPILVVCLTNHALDQFLERIRAFTNKIVRVGGQSRNQNLNSRNLRSLRRALFCVLRANNGTFRSMTYDIKDGIARLSERIENMQEVKKCVETPVGILSAVLLEQVVEPNFLPVVENDETLLQWLLDDIEYEACMENEFVNFDHLYENGMADETEEPVATKKEEKKTINEIPIWELRYLKSYSITLEGVEKKLRSMTEQYDELIQDEGLLLEQGCDSSLIYFEKTYLRSQVKHLTRQYHKLKANLETYVEKPEAKVWSALNLDPAELSSKSRWLIYWSWLSSLEKKLWLEINELERRRRIMMIQYEEFKMFEDLEIMRQADVVGMTTTGAARLHKLLNLLKPAVVVVEEAAEVLEAHIVASLTKSCRHLILIGDHKQLRPSAAVYELSKYYNIDVSLFERMINNGMHCPMLKVQHRMRPEISALITPLIYPDLKNHETVMLLEPIEGVKKNMFFVDHNMPETVAYDEASKENAHEAEFVVKLAKYFIQQGYSPEQITLLTLYAGQVFRIRNLMKDDYLGDVKCVVVDKYQGEENYIVILSLVRSNEEGKIGFLSIENRVCVALSRAKNGFFMIGNMDCLVHTRLWQKLNDILKKNDAIGKELPLYCDRHDKITPVSKAEDFLKDGGCDSVCNLEMECGHDCKRMCHPLLGDHESVNCEEPCKKSCPRNHVCRKLCKEECGKCSARVEKILPCQHVARVRCHVADDDVLCTEPVEDMLLSCNHIVKRKCHQEVEEVECTKPCRKTLSCGHICTRLCHQSDDPDHVQFQCKERCEKYYEGCKKAHLCEKLCYQECGICPFNEEVNLSCGHVFTLPCFADLNSAKCPSACLKICSQCNMNCMKPCWEDCHPCVNKVILRNWGVKGLITELQIYADEPKQGRVNLQRSFSPVMTEVRKVIPACGHEIDVNCSDEPDQKLCAQNCQLMAPCGHKCQLACGEICDSRGCKEWVTSTATKPVCGHENIYVLCGEKNKVTQKTPESFLPNCQEPCGTILECGDLCSGTCGQCFQGRLHQTCPKLCRRTFICGHRCKSPCRELCPPCNEPCSFQCSHVKCNKTCGIPCSTCKKPCEWKCKHSKCTRKCGDICNRQPCNKPCELKLPCGHDCIGFCGEPCPPQCRFCNPEIANAADARFVLMVDCDHIIESRALDLYFSPTFKNGEIVLRGCPQCGTPITKTLRCMNFVKRMYQQIAEVKTKNFEDLRSVDPKNMFLNWRMLPSQCSEVQIFFDFAQFCVKNIPDCSKKHTILPSETLWTCIYFFQACQALISHVHEFGAVYQANTFFCRVLLRLNKLIGRLQVCFNVNRQLMLDFNLELRRYHLMVDYHCIYSYLTKLFYLKDQKVREICAEIEQILFGFTKFTRDVEEKIQSLFEKLKTHPAIGSASLWPKKKLAAKKELPRIFDDLRAGSWFQCSNEHYYCIDQEQNKTDCPECAKKGSSATKKSSRRRRGRR